MTVSYNLDVSSVTTFSFFKLLFRWKGSIWKSVKTELFAWIILYYTVYSIINYGLTEGQKTDFHKLAKQFDSQLVHIPLMFMLGFFVNVIVDRWRQIFNNMGWIENVALTLATVMRGTDAKTVLQRRTIIRYLVLSQVLVLRDISMKVRRRFPNMESLITAGFLHEHELKSLDEVDLVYNKYWTPINWALAIAMRSHIEGNIVAPPSLNNLIGEIRNFRTNLSLLCNFDWVPIPIAYPQVVFLAVRVYFVICLISRQYVPSPDTIDIHVPVITILEFIFLVGWMKVAEALLNPLGEDDDDFECNFLIDKNIATGMSIVDDTFDFHPDLLPDKFKNNNFMPVYSEDSTKNGADSALIGSAQTVVLADPHEEVKMVGVDPKSSMSDLSELGGSARSRSATARMKKRINSAFHLNRARSVQPVELGTSLPANFNLTPQRPIPNSPIENYGDLPSPAKNNFANHILCKVDEEDASSSRSSSRKNTEEEYSDEEMSRVIKNELNGHKKQ